MRAGAAPRRSLASLGHHPASRRCRCRAPSPHEAAPAQKGVGARLLRLRSVDSRGPFSCRRSPRDDLGMTSRVHSAYRTRYRVENWRACEHALVRRGDVTLWLSPDARAAWNAFVLRSTGRAVAILGCGDRDRTHVATHLPFDPGLDGGFRPGNPDRDARRSRRRGPHDALATESKAGRSDGHPGQRTAASDRRQHRTVSGWRRRVGRSATRPAWRTRLEEASSGRRPCGLIVAHALTIDDATRDDR